MRKLVSSKQAEGSGRECDVEAKLRQKQPSAYMRQSTRALARLSKDRRATHEITRPSIKQYLGICQMAPRWHASMPITRVLVIAGHHIFQVCT